MGYLDFMVWGTGFKVCNSSVKIVLWICGWLTDLSTKHLSVAVKFCAWHPELNSSNLDWITSFLDQDYCDPNQLLRGKSLVVSWSKTWQVPSSSLLTIHISQFYKISVLETILLHYPRTYQSGIDFWVCLFSALFTCMLHRDCVIMVNITVHSERRLSRGLLWLNKTIV